MRVIEEDGNNLGVMKTASAIALAEEKGLDLIEISPNAVPPIAKIMDYGKFQYLQNKKEKQVKRGQSTETKILQVKIGTGNHDLELKAKKASAFLKEGHRVRVDLFLPGRTKYLDPAFLNERLERMLNLLTENYKIAEPAKKSPKGLSVVIDRDNKVKKEISQSEDTTIKNENQ